MSLIEIVVSLAMLSMCLLVCASIFTSSARAFTYEETEDASLVAARSAFDLLRSDLEQACAVSTTADSSGTVLALTRVDPSKADASAPFPLPTVSPGLSLGYVDVTWSLTPPDKTGAQNLVRACGGRSVRVAAEVTQFTAEVQTSSVCSGTTELPETSVTLTVSVRRATQDPESRQKQRTMSGIVRLRVVKCAL